MMIRLLKQVGIFFLAGTIVMLVALHTRLSKTRNIRNSFILQLTQVKDIDEYWQRLAFDSNYEENLDSRHLRLESKNTTNDLNDHATENAASKETNLEYDKQERSTTPSLPRGKFVEGSSPDSTKLLQKLEACPNFSNHLVGPMQVNASYEPTLQEALEVAGSIRDGCFTPKWCLPSQTVAIIIPYKDRMRHLITLMHHLHPILQRQAIHYCVFVAEQYDNGAFNKARVMNAAFKEITTSHPTKFDCAIFHDVDMLLEDDRNMHTCTNMPKHLSPAIDKFNYTLNYGTKFGGVTAISVKSYTKVNGHSNNFWGWGGEDNDMEVRIAQSNLTINVTNSTYGRYKMIPHEHPWWFSPLYGVGSYLQSKKHWSVKGVDGSGLSDIRYNLRFTSPHKLWTKLTLDIRTILVEKAIMRFVGYSNIGELEFYSPSKITEQQSTNRANDDIATLSSKDKCSYFKFVNKTVNKTLGLQKKERIRYGRMYHSLEEAMNICDKMHTYCGSIAEEQPGRFSLRATGYVHENYLKYRSGMVKQREVEEFHHTRSVHVKICPGSPSYLNYFRLPIVMAGDARKGPSPAYYTEFKIRLFYPTNATLYYTGDLTTAHRSTLQDQADAGIIETTTWNTLGHVYSNKVKLLNFSEPQSFKKSLPPGFQTMEEVVNKGNGVITIKAPLTGILRYPGCYICRSTLSDENGVALLQWRWWFELRSKTKEIEAEILEAQLERARLSSADFSETVEKRRQMWLNYHKKLSLTQNKDKRGLPDNVLKILRKVNLHA